MSKATKILIRLNAIEPADRDVVLAEIEGICEDYNVTMETDE